MKKVELANSIDQDEVAQYEPPQLDPYCLPSSFWNSQCDIDLIIFFLIFADINFVVCFFSTLSVKAKKLHSDNRDSEMSL